MQRLPLTLTIIFSALAFLLLARILADLSTRQLGKISAGGGVAAPSTPSSGSGGQIRFQTLSPILEKGLFGSATRGTLTRLEQQSSQPVAPQVNLSDLQLLGTAAGTPATSFALIRKNSSNEERVFRLGAQVFDLGRLVAVQKNSADIKGGEQTITLRTPDAPPEQDKPIAAAPVQSTVASGVVAASPGGTGIIDQRALNASLDNIGQAMTDARLLPSMKDGKVEGFRLSEVKPQGVFGALGLKNGDVLAKINDFPIDSPEKAIQSFMTLKGQNRIKLDLVRDGAPTTLSYDIR